MRMYEVYKFKRQALGMTLKDTAEEAGCSTATVSSYENGKQISEIYVRAIRNAIDLAIDRLPDIERMKIIVLQQALCLADEPDDEKALRSCLHLQGRCSQLSIALEKALNVSRKENI